MITNTKIVLFGWEKAIERRSKRKEKKKSKTENLERKTKIVAGFIFPVIMCFIPHLHESSSSSRSLHSDQKCGFSMFPSYLFFNSFYIRETKPFSFWAFFLNSFHDVPHWNSNRWGREKKCSVLFLTDMVAQTVCAAGPAQQLLGRLGHLCYTLPQHCSVD
jgi:hypothetical protein